MKTLRFICFALLFVLILALGVVSDAESSAATADVVEDSWRSSPSPWFLRFTQDYASPPVKGEEPKPRNDSCKNTTAEEDPPSSSATITITWIPYTEENVAAGLCDE